MKSISFQFETKIMYFAYDIFFECMCMDNIVSKTCCFTYRFLADFFTYVIVRPYMD